MATRLKVKESYRIDEVADRWDCHQRTVHRRIKRRELDAFKVGSTWRVRREAIERYERDKSSLTLERYPKAS